MKVIKFKWVGGCGMQDWYESWIEEGVRDVVKHLRNNGVNTVCSCHHDMEIQCQYVAEGEVKQIHDLLWNYLHGKKEPINFSVFISHEVVEGCILCSLLEIKLTGRKKYPRKVKRSDGIPTTG